MRRGSDSGFYFADVTYFFPGRPRRPKMGLSKRDQALHVRFRLNRELNSPETMRTLSQSRKRFGKLSPTNSAWGQRGMIYE